ncbi:MAG: flagellar motor switch protein FliN [Planctomycetota bacterium]
MSDDSDQIGQDDIEALLAAAQSGDAPAPQAEAAPPAADGGGEADGGFSLGQDEIEALMAGGGPASAAAATGAPTASASQAQPAVAGSPAGGASNDVELLLDQAQAAIASIGETDTDLPDGVAPFRLASFGGTPANGESATLELVRDVQLDLKIELGRTRMPLEDVLRLRRDAVVTLDKLAGDPVDVYVNGRLIARGEVLVLNDNFCVRVTELIVGDSAVA